MPTAEGAASQSHRAEARTAASFVSLPPQFKLVWISTRNPMAASDLLTPAPFGRYMLHHVADRMTALYDEFTKAHFAVLDVPLAAEMKYELRMLSMVNRILQAGPKLPSSFVPACDESPTVQLGCTDGIDCDQRRSNSGRHALVSLEMECQAATAPFTWEHRGGTTLVRATTCRLWIWSRVHEIYYSLMLRAR